MGAAQLNIVIEQNSTWTTELFLVDNTTSLPVDLTAAVATMELRAKVGGTIFDTLSTGGGEITIIAPPTDGKMELELSAAQTAALDFGSGVYDLIVDLNTGDRLRVIEGTVVLSPAVTI